MKLWPNTLTEKRRRRTPDWVDQALKILRPHRVAIQVVANGVRGDSRVIKSALVSIESGVPTLLMGLSLTEEYDYFETQGVPVLLVPFSLWGTPTDKRLGKDTARSWKRRQRIIRRWRLARSVKGLKVGYLSGWAWRSIRGARTKSWTQIRPNDLAINASFAHVFDQLEPRLIHVHDTVPLPAAIAHAAQAQAAGTVTKVIYDSHECNPELVLSFPDAPLYAAVADIEAKYIRDAWRVVTVSPQIAKLLQRRYRLRTRPLVVTNGPSRERDLTAPSLREVVGLAPDVPLVVYSGWVSAERGLVTVLRALTIMPNVHLAIVVNSANAHLFGILKLAKTLKVFERVHLAPYVVPSQITQYLSSADIGLIPLKSGGHLDLSLPTKFREYAMAGLPMVVSDNKAMAAEINRTKIGRVFKAGNVGGLALQVGRVLDSPQRYRDRITDSLLDDYAWETQALQLRPLYESVMLDGDDKRAGILEEVFGFVSPKTDSTDSADEPDPNKTREHGAWQTANAKYYGVKLGIGRANSAGQAYQWANAMSTKMGLTAESFAPERQVTHEPHVTVRRSMSVQQGAVELGRIATQYTYLLVDGFESLFGPLFENDLERELEVLRPHLFGLGLVAHGSEVRDPDAHLANIDGSYFAQAEETWVDVLREISSKNREIAARFDGPLFVSTPDLLSDLPTARWLPVVVDAEKWSAVPSLGLGRRLRVLHQPSRSDPPIKGTDVIHPVLERLDAQNVIEYVRSEEMVSADEMPALVERCDVVVDQIRTGSYGVAATEAMMAGRVVVGHVSKTVRREIEDDVPIVDAPPIEFESVIRSLAQADDAELAAIGEAGREFANKWHDGRYSSQVILHDFLDA